MQVPNSKPARRRWVLGAAVVLSIAVAAAAAARNESSGPPVLHLAEAQTSVGDDTERSAAATEMSRWRPVEYRFELDDDVTVDAGTASAWQLQPPHDLATSARRLAELFGIDGQPVARGGDGALHVGPADGSGPVLRVRSGGEWTFNDRSSYLLRACAEPAGERPDPQGFTDEQRGDDGERSDTDRGVGSGEDGHDTRRPAVERCARPQAPSGLPDAAEAQQLAEALFAAAGTPGPIAGFDVRADGWATHVSGRVEVGGVRTDIPASVVFGQDAAVVSAAGTFATTDEVGGYPTVDAAGALERLDDRQALLRSGGAALPLPMPEPAPPAPGRSGPSPGDGDGRQPGPDAKTDPDVRVEPDLGPVPAPDGEAGRGDGEPETVTVVLVSVERTLELADAQDGTRWLIPSLRFTAADGGTWQVFAVADGYLELTGPGADIPTDDGDGGSGSREPPVPSDRDVVSPDRPDGDAPSDDHDIVAPDDRDVPEPGDGPPRDPHDLEGLAREVTGSSESAATDRIESAGGTVRIVHRDGEDKVGTTDYRPDRVNLWVVDGTVARASVG